MKLTKLFGIVLSLHVGVILLVMFQPGCQTTGKKENIVPEAKEEIVGNTESFNSGLNDPENSKKEKPTVSPKLSEPTRPVAGELFVPVENNKVIPVPLPELVDDKPIDLPNINLLPEDVSIYKVVKGDTLWGIARKNNISLSDLLASNPSLSKSSRLKIGQEIMVNQPKQASLESTNTINETPQSIPVGSTTYTVKSGDSLTKIARMNGVALSSLMIANNLNGGAIIRPGQVLIIPVEESIIDNKTNTNNPVPISNGSTHKVSKGENLSRIAIRYGISVKDIMEWNDLQDASKIRIGQVLNISKEPNLSIPTEKISSPSDTENTNENDATKVEDFFKGVVEERPVIDVPEE